VIASPTAEDGALTRLVVALARCRDERAIECRLNCLSMPQLRGLREHWFSWAHRGQLPPEGDWRVWLMMAGRGFGKTRAGAETVSEAARRDGRLRIALVGATPGEAERVMILGESGLFAVARTDEELLYVRSKGVVEFASGAQAFVFSGANPEALRGVQHHFAWCDELAKWAYPEAAWNNLMMGLRLGEQPRVLVTTTPRPIATLKGLLDTPRLEVTRGRTADNLNLADEVRDDLYQRYGGTRLGRQELDGELIDDVEGALWTRAMIEKARIGGDSYFQHRGTRPGSAAGESNCPLVRVVIGVDPPASASGDACGIVACGLGPDGVAYVLGDHTVRGLSPEGWARGVADAAELWGADKVVVEANQGGEMVESVLRGADVALPVKSVHARYGKGRRAEPVATWFAKGKAKFAGAFPDLEDELAGLTYGGGYEGPGRSPDRADAMVWAMTELLGGKERPMPRITRL
jgi:phage terminase large subunit-like protein